MTTNNNNRVPELRFPGFTGEWEVKKLGEILDYEQPTPYLVSSESYKEEGTPVLTAGKTFILGYTNETSGIYNKIPTIIFDDFTTESKYVTFPFKAKSSAMKMLSLKDKADSLYFAHTLMMLNQKTIGDHKRHWISETSQIKILIPPTKAEQQKIADCLSSLDEEIAAEAQKADALKDHKKGLMQQLFPQPGQTTPQRRFPGFEGEWEASTISDIFEIRNGYTPSKRISEYWEGGTIPWFRMEDIRENGGILADAIQHITPLGVKGKGLFKKNSIILATTATIGIHAMLIADSLANQQFTNFSIRESLKHLYSPIYVYYAFFGIDEWCKKNTNAGGLLSVNMPSLLKQPFPTPTLAEQQKIADCLSELDEMISAQQQKVEALKEDKKGLMQKLFPKM